MASTGSSSSNWVMESGDIPHVLAVDDNLIDRKLVEKLLRNSSCKGKGSYHILSVFLPSLLVFEERINFGLVGSFLFQN